MNITITPKKSEGAERLLEVSVPADDVRRAEESAARRYASQARLPGFRPGKAPAAMVKKKFADAIRQETLEQVIREAFDEVVKRENLQVISQPHVHHVHFHDDQPLTFELHLEVRPEITLAKTEGFTAKRPPVSIGDAEVDEQLERIREQKATWAPSEDKPMPGDMVVVELATADEGGELPEGKEYRLELGSGQAIPGVEELIMEATPGETVERPVKWPEDFPDEAQRGKTKPVRVHLKEVKRRTLPALDDAFAREVGDFDDLAALRTTVREDLVRHATQEADAEVRSQLVDRIIEANPFDVPPSWVMQLVEGYAQMYQLPQDQLEQFATEFRPIAEKQVRRDLVIETLAQRESLAATESEIDDKVAELAAKRNADVGQVYASLQKAGRLREIERGITEDKVFAWLTSRNTVE